MMSRYRVALFAAGIALNFALLSTAASAAITMVVGPRTVVQNMPVSDCSTRAKSALNTVLVNAFEAGAGTGQWLARGPVDSSGQASSAAAIHCFPVDKGYVVTFTCIVEVPSNAGTADGLCAKLTAAFGPGKTASIAAPAHVSAQRRWR